MKLSIGMPTYNRKDKLTRAVQSVLKQTYQNWELIISNNASTDDTFKYLDTIKDSRITVVNNGTNIGQFNNLFQTYKLSTQPFFCWLSDDDYICEKFFLEKVALAISQNKQVSLIYSGRKLFDAKKQIEFNSVNGSDQIYTSMSDWWVHKNKEMIINMSGVFIKKNKFIEDIQVDPGGGWGYDDLLYTTAIRAGFALELPGHSVALSVNTLDNNSENQSHQLRLDSLKQNKQKLIQLIINDVVDSTLKVKAKKIIENKFMETHILKSYVWLQVRTPSGKFSNIQNFIKENRFKLTPISFLAKCTYPLFLIPFNVRIKFINWNLSK